MVRKTSIVLLIIAILIVSSTGFTEVLINPNKIYDQGIKVFENGNYIKAMKLFEKAVEAGLSDSERLVDVYELLIILSYKTDSKSMRQIYEQKYTNISGKHHHILKFISNLINSGKKDMAKSAISCWMEQIDSNQAKNYACFWIVDAAGKGYEDLVKTLMKYKPELNDPTLCFASGQLANALIAATKNGHVSVVKILLENGAIGTIVDTGVNGRSAINYAFDLKRIDILRLYNKYGVLQDQRPDINEAKQAVNNFLSALVRNDYKSAYNQLYTPNKRDISLDKFQAEMPIGLYGGGPLTKFDIILVFIDNTNKKRCDVLIMADNNNQKMRLLPLIKDDGIWKIGKD